MVIVPPDAWHSFTNTGDTLLRQTAIHQNPRAATEFEDVMSPTSRYGRDGASPSNTPD